MDKNYKSVKHPSKKNKQKSENKTRNKKVINNENNKYTDKIDFGSDTYLTYKLNNDEDMSLQKGNIELIRQKVLNSNNFRMGYLNSKIKENSLYKNKHINLTEVKRNKYNNKNRINIKTFLNDEKKNKHVIKILNSNLDKNDQSERKNDYTNTNDNYNLFDTDFSTKRNFISTKEVMRQTSPFVENIKKNKKSNSIIEINRPFINRSSTDLTNKISNSTNCSRKIHNNYNNNNNNNIKYNITNYMDKNKSKPVDLTISPIVDNCRTSINFKDYKNIFTYRKINNNLINISNNNIKVKPLSKLTEEIYNINDITKSNEQKLNRISKKTINLKHIEKLIRKNVISNSIVELLMNGRKHNVKLRANLNKIKKQMKHLSVVDKIEKYSDNIPAEKMETFNKEYYKKSDRIGISNRCITFRNGKIYQQSKSESKKLGQRIEQNCDEINKLTDQILIDKYYFDKKNLKCQKILETIKFEKKDSSFNNHV
jgi:hypothetical protein